MRLKNCWLVLLFFWVYQDIVHAYDKPDFYWGGRISPSLRSNWYELGHSHFNRIESATFFLDNESKQLQQSTHRFVDDNHSNFASFCGFRIFSICKANITTAVLSGGAFLINFQPKDQFGILGVSVCWSKTSYDCYVIEIFGLVSGRMGYVWRKHSWNETGEELWVPGKEKKIPSTIIKQDVAVKAGTWDREGKTQYQFFIEDGDDNHVRIRYNGETAEQQREMDFKLPNTNYVYTVASYYTDSLIEVEGSSGCTIFKRMQLEPGQDVNVYWKNPLGSFGISLCTDSGQYECYVLELIGVSDHGLLNYFWRKHSLLDDAGDEGWVPGLDIKLKGTVVAQGKNKWKFMDASAWHEAKTGISLAFKRTNDETLQVVVALTKSKPQYYFNPPQLEFNITNEYQYTTVGNRAMIDGQEVNQPDIVTYGPCFDGGTLDYISPTCKQKIVPRDPYWPKGDYFYIVTTRPGVAEASLEGSILESKAPRKNLCLSLLGMASPKANITVTAEDASDSNMRKVVVGQLTFNKIYPPEWQRVRLFTDLPPYLHNAPLKVKLTAERATAESFVLVAEVKRCSFDGCGTPTPEGTAFIAYGEKTTPAKYPWHVAVFKKNQTQFLFACGGTLIRSDAVVTAAHCFCDESGKLLKKESFKLAVGKKFNSLYTYEPNQQLSDALHIYLAPRYKGIITNFVNDIAIVRVNFTTSPLVVPSCLDWFGKSESTLQVGEVGQVAGWGLHEENVQSSELYFANLPYIPYDQCKKAIPETFLVYVTPDKFCAGNINGSSVRRGDSGGGLVFRKGGLWYLRGVVSLGVHDRLTYSTFTEVSQFLPWIRTVLNVTS